MPANLLAIECGFDNAPVHLPHVRQNTKGGIYINKLEALTAPLAKDLSHGARQEAGARIK